MSHRRILAYMRAAPDSKSRYDWETNRGPPLAVWTHNDSVYLAQLCQHPGVEEAFVRSFLLLLSQNSL